MKVNETRLVGVGVSSDGDFVRLVAHKTEYGDFSVFLNDDPFGITELYGFKDFEIVAITDDDLNDLEDILLDSDFSKFKGIIKLEDGYAFVEDWFSGECGYIKGSLSIADYVKIPELQDSGEVEDGNNIPYLDEVINLF